MTKNQVHKLRRLRKDCKQYRIEYLSSADRDCGKGGYLQKDQISVRFWRKSIHPERAWIVNRLPSPTKNVFWSHHAHCHAESKAPWQWTSPNLRERAAYGDFLLRMWNGRSFYWRSVVVLSRVIGEVPFGSTAEGCSVQANTLTLINGQCDVGCGVKITRGIEAEAL